MAHGIYDPLLVTVSVLIAMFASYTALDIANRVSTTQARARALWVCGGSLAMGVGIWSMHFVGMLAFQMPGMTIVYDVPLLILSVVVAIAASAIALYVVSWRQAPRFALAGAALAMGAAICGMHYIGIAGMLMPARVEWDRRLVLASIAIAIGAAYAALWLARRLRRHGGAHLLRLLAGIVMGFAIAGMHYTAMAAMIFTPLEVPYSSIGDEGVLATNELAMAVIVSTILILTLALVSSIAGRKVERQTELAEESTRRFREADRRAVEEEALRLATEEVASALTFDEILTNITGSALAATAADGAFVENIDRPAAEVRIVAARGATGPPVESRLPLAESFSARVSGHREPLMLDEPELIGDAWAPAALLPEVSGLIVVPLVEDEQPLGALVLWRQGGRPPFTADERTRAFTFAHLATLAFKRIRLMEESEKRREQLELADRLAALGRVASTMAHEFNNVLMSIQAFHEVTRRVGTFDEYVAHAPQIERAIQRGKSVTDAVLRLTRATQPNLQCLDLSRWLATLRAELVSLMPPDVDVSVECDDDLFVRADASHLEQALINLALNARDAMPGGGTLTIAATQEGDDSSHADHAATIHMMVGDTGAGMAEEVRARIFEPLYTTKPAGTGLGLAIVHEIIRAHGGTISVATTKSKGTEFHIRLDAAPPAEAAAASAARTADYAVERIVLVEDDDGVAEGLTLMLELEGFQVKRVARGGDTLTAIREFRPDAVVLDVGLPDIDGVVVFHMIERDEPGMPVVFATGHADQAGLGDILQREHVAFIRKPFETASLIDAIHQAAAGAARVARR